MSDKNFSYGEMIAHGWDRTKKYAVTLLLMMVIYVAVNGMDGIISHYAGEPSVTKNDVEDVVKDPGLTNQLLVDLYTDGIISKNGLVRQNNLKMITAPADLKLSPELESKRDEIFDMLEKYRYRLPFPAPVYYLIKFAFWVLSTIMAIGYLQMTLKISRDEKPFLSELFTRWDKFIPYLLSSVCYGLAIVGGAILLIVPGFIMAYMLGMYAYLIIDKGYGPIAALKRSRVITKGVRMRLFLFTLLLGLLNLAGIICLIVGVVVTVSIGSIAMARVYDYLENAPEVTAQ